MVKRRTTGSTCRVCGKCEADGYAISQRRLCPECGELHAIEAIVQLREKAGPIYDKWIAGIVEGALKTSGVGVPDFRKLFA